jgi:cellulose synthase/poly-beta-1,6-N-acetylglucosamine synthase-like glycosyltransferase
MRLSVLIPTYRRPRDLMRCLGALTAQTRPADEVVVVARPDDAGTWAVLNETCWRDLPLNPVTVTRPGQVVALNAGLDTARGGILVITDDDAAPRPDWLARIVAHFEACPRVGAVGGRDVVHSGGGTVEGSAPVVGRLQWFGRAIGNHHLGVGGPRSVDVLKGVNMSFRRQAMHGLRFDGRLRGTGAQVHNDLAISLAVRRAGWKLIYDPAVAVDHYPAERHDEDARGRFDRKAVANAAHNEMMILLEHLGPTRRIAFMLWAWSVGTRASPGLAQWLRLWPSEGGLATAKWRAAAQGRVEGWRTWRRGSTSAGDQPPDTVRVAS